MSRRFPFRIPAVSVVVAVAVLTLALLLPAVIFGPAAEAQEVDACSAALYDGPDGVNELATFAGADVVDLGVADDRADSIVTTCDVVVAADAERGGWCYSLPPGLFNLPPNELSHVGLKAKGCPGGDVLVTNGPWTPLERIARWGQLPQSRCPYGVTARGFAGTSTAGSIDGVQLTCGAVGRDGSIAGRLRSSGVAGDAAWAVDCGTGRVLVGATGSADADRVYSIAPLCADVVDRDAAWVGDPVPGLPAGSSGGGAEYVRQCPPDTALVSAVAQHDAAGLIGLSLYCSPLKWIPGQQTPMPTVAPTVVPEPTPEPTVAPEPTPEPTVAPTVEPTLEPTVEPTVAPTLVPTVELSRRLNRSRRLRPSRHRSRRLNRSRRSDRRSLVRSRSRLRWSTEQSLLAMRCSMRSP